MMHASAADTSPFSTSSIDELLKRSEKLGLLLRSHAVRREQDVCDANRNSSVIDTRLPILLAVAIHGGAGDHGYGRRDRLPGI